MNHSSISMKSRIPLAVYSALGMGICSAYLISLSTTTMEGANGYAFVYAIIPMTIISYIVTIITPIRYITISIVTIATVSYICIGIMVSKDIYLSKNCKTYNEELKQKTLHNPICTTLKLLPRW